MSEEKTTGFRSAVWALGSGLALAAISNLFSWLFPSVDVFFEASGKWLKTGWAFLTATWTVPAVPLVLGMVAIGVMISHLVTRVRKLTLALAHREPEAAAPQLRVARDDLLASAAPVAVSEPSRFTSTQASVLAHLLHASQNEDDTSVMAMTLVEPLLVVQDAVRKLEAEGLVESKRRSLRDFDRYALTQAGKALVLDKYHALQASRRR